MFNFTPASPSLAASRIDSSETSAWIASLPHVKTSAYVTGELRQIDGAFDGRAQGSHDQDGHHLSTRDSCREGGDPRPALCAHRLAPRPCAGPSSTSR